MHASRLRLTLHAVLQCCRETPPAEALGAGGACAPHGNLIPHVQFLPKPREFLPWNTPGLLAGDREHSRRVRSFDKVSAH